MSNNKQTADSVFQNRITPQQLEEQKVEQKESEGIIKSIAYKAIDSNKSTSEEKKLQQKKMIDTALLVADAAMLFIPVGEATEVGGIIAKGLMGLAKAGAGADLGGQFGKFLDTKVFKGIEHPVFEDALTFAGGLAGGTFKNKGLTTVASKSLGKVGFGLAGAAHGINTINNWNEYDTYEKVREGIYGIMDLGAISSAVSTGKGFVNSKQTFNGIGAPLSESDTEHVFNELVKKSTTVTKNKKKQQISLLQRLADRIIGTDANGNSKVTVKNEDGKIELIVNDNVTASNGFIPATNKKIEAANSKLSEDKQFHAKEVKDANEAELILKQFISITHLDAEGNSPGLYTPGMRNIFKILKGFKSDQIDHLKPKADIVNIGKKYANSSETFDPDYIANTYAVPKNAQILSGQENTWKGDGTPEEMREFARGMVTEMDSKSGSPLLQYLYNIPNITQGFQPITTSTQVVNREPIESSQYNWTESVETPVFDSQQGAAALKKLINNYHDYGVKTTF